LSDKRESRGPLVESSLAFFFFLLLPGGALFFFFYFQPSKALTL
jgi:hypothetical protein